MACPPDGPRSIPSIVSFHASSSALCAPGTVTLSWAQADGDQVSIDNGIGDVSTVTKKTVYVGATTTFTLTATNELGTSKKTMTVAVNNFPEKPFGANAAMPGDGVVFSADRLSLAYADTAGSRVFVCSPSACTTHALYTNVLANSVFLVAADGDRFTVFATTNYGGAYTPRVHTQAADGTFSSGEPITGLPVGHAPMAFALDEPSGRAALVSAFYMNGEVYLSERVNGMWSSTPVQLAGVTLKTTIILATGFADDLTPYILYLTGLDTLTLIRRQGSVWTVVTSKSINGGTYIARQNSPSAVVSPDGSTALVSWGLFSNTTYTGWATTVDLTSNTIGTSTAVLPAVPATLANNFRTHAAFSAGSDKAKLVYSTVDQRAWIGNYSKANGFAAATVFHPEWLIELGTSVGYNSCDEPLVVYTEKQTAGSPPVGRVERL